MLNKTIRLTPSQLLTIIFLFFTTVGAIVLKMPFSTNEPITWIDAWFTSVSAMTVTGLGVVDTGTHFSVFGQVVIAILIQLGGLGIMSFAVMVFMMLGRKIGFKHRLVMQQALNQVHIGGVIKLVKNLFLFSITIELIAMVFLAIRWVPEWGLKKGLFFSFFHSISAFNNAGFALWPDSLMRYVGDPIINIVISLLFMIGGIGFTVLIDLKEQNTFSKLSLHSKMMIVGTLAINVVAMLMIFILEYANAKTLAPLSLFDKLFASYFQAVSPRTAGFNTLDISSLNESTIFFIIILMFIGAGSASTGGGIKLTTFMVICLATVTYFKGREDIKLFRKTIPASYIARVMAISMTSIVAVVAAVLILNITEDLPFLTLLFEVVSAFGTVGLSMGITSSLSVFAKLIIILVMYVGKLGPLTLVYLLAKPRKEKYKYPTEDILTG
ncbi:TrkH family potassium uptake protein [Cytobacillus spongiae]|uniref:TrkH family potassium uptake protein n=1 Tax=Cytobacillus spongiae TaxID=2901381 RepID=UPI001F37CFDC|nr:TrkH family potassium uptake protein [Cytobacillus spongiae]UII54444.1 TrkH family potassium uptake protein [Cytobacillus spongiae]